MAAWRSGVQLLPPPARITIRQPRPAHPAAPRDTARGTRGTCSQASPCSSWCAAWPRCAWRPRRRVCCPAPLSTVPGPWSQAPPPWPAAETEMEPHHHQLLGLSLLAATQHQPPAVRQLWHNNPLKCYVINLFSNNNYISRIEIINARNNILFILSMISTT